MAPEIINGEGHNKTVDWWSFGILMLYILSFLILIVMKCCLEFLRFIIRTKILCFSLLLKTKLSFQVIHRFRMK